jgi:4-aminobutyrate aminotransferase-like enzyme
MCGVGRVSVLISRNIPLLITLLVLAIIEDSGVILPSDDFIMESVIAVRHQGGVFIADEVQTGFGRLGSSFWAFENGNHGIVPDIVTVGKPFGNGMSLGAVITTQKIAQAFDGMGVEYFNTFGGNPVVAAAGLAVLDVLEEESLQQHALQVGEYLKEQFWTLQKERLNQDLIGDIRGNGLFLGIDIVQSAQTRTPGTAKTSFLCSKLKQRYNILTSIDGLHNNVLVIKPPMVFSKADADLFVKCFEQVAIELEQIGDAVNSMEMTPT